MTHSNMRAVPNLSDMSSVLAALAREDSLKILIAAHTGITHSTQTIKELNLTQKRYYTRLRALMRVGLIERRDTGYSLTTLGKVCYSLGEGFLHAITCHDRLELADRLQQVSTLSLDESQQILAALSRNGFLGTSTLTTAIQPMKMLSEYEQLVTELVDRIDKAKQAICLASYYMDVRVIEALIRALHRGVSVLLVSDLQETMAQRLRLIKMLLMPKVAQLLLDMILQHKIRVKHHALKYSFCIIDDTYVIMELPNQLTRDFHVGFSLASRKLSHSLLQTFHELYQCGEDDPMFAILQRNLQSDHKSITTNDNPLPIF
jgi:DNA-binding HxlR family transcriptional regulator